MQTRQEKLQAWDRLIAWSSAVPSARAYLPNMLMMQRLVGDTMEMPDVAASIGDPGQMEANLKLEMLLGQGGPAQNGVPPQGQQPGMPALQAAGGTTGV